MPTKTDLIIWILFAIALSGSIVVHFVSRRRGFHLCECGHRRNQHADDWGDFCDHCPCAGFVRIEKSIPMFHHKEGCPCERCTMLDATSQQEKSNDER